MRELDKKRVSRKKIQKLEKKCMNRRKNARVGKKCESEKMQESEKNCLSQS